MLPSVFTSLLVCIAHVATALPEPKAAPKQLVAPALVERDPLAMALALAPLDERDPQVVGAGF